MLQQGSLTDEGHTPRDRTSTDWYRRWGKRTLDLILVIPAIVVLMPLMAVIGLLVWLKLGWPIVFSHKRPGKDNQPFQLLKFRTMTNEKDANGVLLPAEVRVTPFGRSLRAVSLDELPELFNVLRGDMSLVGPRPLLMDYLPLYSPEQRRRHEVLPGITGWAQVNGRNLISWDDRFRLDVWYVDHRSAWLDMKILWLTVLSVVRREGIDQAGYVGAERFTGSHHKNVEE
ncbi:MAG TPA: sugar transferase [Aggregatilineaceae bacterium]|nr:sugar transferase [Aggregatilineaceae bacterium]